MFIKPCEGRMTSPFGMRNHPIKSQRTFHKGIDLAKSGKVPILAAANGKVSRVAKTGAIGQYGNVVFVVHTLGGKTYETIYAHLASYSVKVGQAVKQGQQIGLMGNTGGSTGQHLHFEVHIGRWTTGQPNAVDPQRFINVYDTPQKGAFGADVTKLQRQLNQLGYGLLVDGNFGDSMDKVVKSFQQKSGLTADGIFGEGSQQALIKAIDAQTKAKKEAAKEEVKGVQIEKEVKRVIKLTAGQQKAKDNLVKHGLMSADYEIPDGQILTLVTMVSPLLYKIEKDKQFDPSTDELHDYAINFVKEATNDGTLKDGKWLEQAHAGTLTDQDLLALYIFVNEERKK